ncbi:alpha/beta fold hydrolase [Halothermothrix orenii]|uniref:alpha/beta fold hydrolase n=1 Tax=Halothermothrix orenii TaxID=31909 RepID=UPI0014389C8B|nr:alpha/beta fold hydrolase [Halothermothrix orenii]
MSIWLLNPYEAMDYAIEIMGNKNGVRITRNDWIVVEPANLNKVDTGFIFYPGGRVKAEAYTPLAFNIARSGYKVVIVPMPVNLAIFGINEADKVIKKYNHIDNWVIGGHSLGGAMAARYASENPSRITGLILLASYPSKEDDLSRGDLDVLSIYATRDGIATAEKINNSKELLPADTVWVKIEGGNHSQFGFYGFQSGDNEAIISRKEQQKETIKAIKKFLLKIKR